MLGVFLDLETTGLDAKRHRVVELACRIIDLETGEERAVYDTVVKQPPEVWDRRDPHSIAINGFTWERVETGEPESLVREHLITMLGDAGVRRGQAVFICQNPSFDRNFLTQMVDVYEQERLAWPYHWLDLASMYWACRVRANTVDGQPLPAKLSVSKDSIAEFYGLPPEAKPHRAINGVDHLILCYKAVLAMPQRV